MQQAVSSYPQQYEPVLTPGGFGVMPQQQLPVQQYQLPPVLRGATRSKHWTGSMTRTIAHYERLEQVGEGAYGQVYKARCKDTGRFVALKKLIIQHGGYNGMTPSVVREIKILQRLRHPRLVELIEVVSSKGVEHLDEHDDHRSEQKAKKESKDTESKGDSRIIDAREAFKGNLFLVLEYVSHDLMALLDVRYQFSEMQVKCIFKQLLEALEYMHDQKYVHRDLKPANILIDSLHRVKLADFGLARCIEPPILDKLHDRRSSLELTNKVVTVMYRPLEILLGATRYGYSVDMWSAGCILAELVLGKTLLPGKVEMDQINLIFDLLGTPTSTDGLQDLPLLRMGKVKIEKQKKSRLREKYINKMSMPCLNLLEKLLERDPNKRLSASRALESRYFKTEPRAPEYPEQLGLLQLGGGEGDFHEFQTKKKRKEAKSIANAAKEEAKERGATEEEAESIFREVYDEQMVRVQEEGISALKTKEELEKEEEKRRREAEKQREEERVRREEERARKEEERVRKEKEATRARREEERRSGDNDRKHRRDDDEQDRRDRDEQDRKRRLRQDDEFRRSGHRDERDDRRRDDKQVDHPSRRHEEERRHRGDEGQAERRRSSSGRRDDDRNKDERRERHRDEKRRRSSEKRRYDEKLEEGSKVYDSVLRYETHDTMKGSKETKVNGNGLSQESLGKSHEGYVEGPSHSEDKPHEDSGHQRGRGERSRERKKSKRDRHRDSDRPKDLDRHRNRDRDRVDRDRDRDREHDRKHDRERDLDRRYRDDYDRRGPPPREFHDGPPPPRADYYGDYNRGPPSDHRGPPSRGHPDRGPPERGPPERGPPPEYRGPLDRGPPPDMPGDNHYGRAGRGGPPPGFRDLYYDDRPPPRRGDERRFGPPRRDRRRS